MSPEINIQLRKHQFSSVCQKQITLHTSDTESNDCHFLQRIERFECVISLLIVGIHLLILMVVAVLSASVCLIPDYPHVSHVLLSPGVCSIGSWQYRHSQFQNQCQNLHWDRSLKLGMVTVTDPTKLYVPAQHVSKSIHTSCILIIFENSFFSSDAHRGSSRLSVYITATLLEQT